MLVVTVIGRNIRCPFPWDDDNDVGSHQPCGANKRAVVATKAVGCELRNLCQVLAGDIIDQSRCGVWLLCFGTVITSIIGSTLVKSNYVGTFKCLIPILIARAWGISCTTGVRNSPDPPVPVFNMAFGEGLPTVWGEDIAHPQARRLLQFCLLAMDAGNPELITGCGRFAPLKKVG